jgi:polar amino acid transport system permease protein
MLLRATLLNIELLLALLAVGFVVGTIVAVLQVYGGRVLGILAFIYEWIFRSIPALVLLFIVYFGPARFGLATSRFLSATIALGLCSSGYQSQIFRGAIQSISSGQMMAARALGMSRTRAIASVILPQALRLSIPGWSNEFSAVVKDTTLAYAVGYNELLRAARAIMDRHYDLAMLSFLTVALIFLVLTYAGNWSLGLLERRTRIPGLQVAGWSKEGHS